MEDTCLFAESLCYILNFKPGLVGDLIIRLEHEAKFVTLGDLKPRLVYFPPNKKAEGNAIRLFGGASKPFIFLDHDPDNKLLQAAGLFRLHVCRLADDAIRDQKPLFKYEQVREQVSDIAKQFNLDQWNRWTSDFDFWKRSLTQSSLEALQKCLADIPTSQQHSEFSHMLNLPEPFLQEVFKACPTDLVDGHAVRTLLDYCGSYCHRLPEEELKQLCDQAEQEEKKRDFKYWKHVIPCASDGPYLKESQARELAEYMYSGCTELGIDCRILIGKGSVWVFVLVKERLSRQKRNKIAKVFDEFIQSRRENQLSWMFAGRPEERSPFFLPSGLQRVLDFIRLMVGDELPNCLILNVRNIRPLVLECLRRRNEHVEPWQLRMVSGSRDLCDDDWIQDTSGLRILKCEDWTQWEDSALKNLVLEIASHLPKRPKECALMERRTCAPLAYLCQALKDSDGIDPCSLLPGCGLKYLFHLDFSCLITNLCLVVFMPWRQRVKHIIYI